MSAARRADFSDPDNNPPLLGQIWNKGGIVIFVSWVGYHENRPEGPIFQTPDKNTPLIIGTGTSPELKIPKIHDLGYT